MRSNCLSLVLLALVIPAIALGCKRNSPNSGAQGGAGGSAIQVVAVEARQQSIVETISLIGSIAANEMIEVKAEMDGIVREINFKEGQKVQKGETLVVLDETKLAAELAEGEANFRLSQTSFSRTQQLLRDKLISQQDFDQSTATLAVNQAGLELKRRRLKDARVIASFGGIVGAQQISPGQVISRNSTLTWLVDLDVVKVEVNVPEKYLNRIGVGQQVEFRVAAYPEERFKGEIYFVTPQLDLSTRTALVKARIPNPDSKLKSGMFANLDLTLQLRESAIVVPEPSLISNGDKVSVFVIDDKSNATMKPVVVGTRLAGFAEIVSGLKTGEKVIVEGVQKLRPGAGVRLGPPEAAAPYLK